MLTEEMKQKSITLENAKIALKNKFIGIDDVIDQFINSVRVWYLMPNLMTRPMIVNLWGLTGSGKTDLVRTFVNIINMSHSFVEIQMDNTSTGSLQYYIEMSDISTSEQSILLLDEMQRFRTVNEDGKEVKQREFQDMWMLLSDGKFQSESSKKRQIMEIIYNELYQPENVEDDDGNAACDVTSNQPVVTKSRKKSKYKMSVFSAQYLKKLIKCPESVEEIMTWDNATKLYKAKEALEDNSTYESQPYSKMLIIIAGNIDEAYGMAEEVSNADTDADIFYEFSKRISIVTIKDALCSRFKPEQISRFGNNHIIYNSLSKLSYQKIIKKNLNSIIDRVKSLHDINITLDKTVYDTIYQNGVFPSQGVRPVISTIVGIFETYLPLFLFRAIEKDITNIHVLYQDNNIVGLIGDETLSYKVELSIKKVKENRTIDEITAVAVHEAGHCLIYSLLFGITPTQIMCVTSNQDNAGFIGTHPSYNDSTLIRNTISVLVAGQVAESFVFGKEFRSCGSSSDLCKATNLASGFVRNWGFSDFHSQIRGDSPEAHMFNIDIEKSNPIIDKMVEKAKEQALSLLETNKELFQDIVKELVNKTEITPERLVEIFAKYNIIISVKPCQETFIHNFNDKLNQFIGEA